MVVSKLDVESPASHDYGESTAGSATDRLVSGVHSFVVLKGQGEETSISLERDIFLEEGEVF